MTSDIIYLFHIRRLDQAHSDGTKRGLLVSGWREWLAARNITSSWKLCEEYWPTMLWEMFQRETGKQGYNPDHSPAVYNSMVQDSPQDQGSVRIPYRYIMPTPARQKLGLGRGWDVSSPLYYWRTMAWIHVQDFEKMLKTRKHPEAIHESATVDMWQKITINFDWETWQRHHDKHLVSSLVYQLCTAYIRVRTGEKLTPRDWLQFIVESDTALAEAKLIYSASALYSVQYLYVDSLRAKGLIEPYPLVPIVADAHAALLGVVGSCYGTGG